MHRRWIRNFIGVVILSAIVVAGLGIKTLFTQEFDPVNETSEIIKLHIMRSIRRDVTALAQEQVKTAILAELDKQAAILFWRSFTNYGSVIALITGLTVLLILASALYYKLTTHTLKTKYSEVPFRGTLPPEIASGLVLAEQLEARLPEKALELYARLADVNTRQLHALSRATGQRPAAPPARPPAALPVATGPAPPFATLLQEGQIAAGNPLIFGFSNGQPQYRHPQEIKSMAVAGWQGSGKTLTSGYIVACLLLQYPTSEVYIIDPHHKHAESLTTLVKPLAVTPRLHLINPFDTPAILRTLNTTLDDRLENRQPSEPPLFLIIDELARLGKSLSDADFNAFIAFLERCTEETRKANLCFWGISQKWSARNFKNRKDIRECMPSLLIHKTKPGQAELLLEGRAEKKLVQRLSHPGEALLATSHDTDPQVVKMPLITSADMLAVAQMIQARAHQPVQEITRAHIQGVTDPVRAKIRDTDSATGHEPVTATVNGGTRDMDALTGPEPVTATVNGETRDMDALTGPEPVTATVNGGTRDMDFVTGPEPVTDTVNEELHPFQDDMLFQQLEAYLTREDTSISKLDTISGVNKGLLSSFHRGKRALSDANRGRLAAVLQAVAPL